MKCMFYLSGIFLLFLGLSSGIAQDQKRLIDYVDPFIGTGGWGNTFPGAVVPFGMISISPHNMPGAASGYKKEGKHFYGFGHNHLNGTGCADLGSIIVTFMKDKVSTNPEEYKTTFSNETASPGYYSLKLDNLGLTIESTVTARSGIYNITSDETTEIILLIDAGRSLAIEGGGSIYLNEDNSISGSNISGGFCGEINRQTLYFYAELSKSPTLKEIWFDNHRLDSSSKATVDTNITAAVTLNMESGVPLQLKIGISYTSIENAKENLYREIPNWDFESIKASAEETWEEYLSRIIIDDKNKENLVKFYTSLYHTLIHPNIINDINGDYPLMGRRGTGNYSNRSRYSVYSLWDTYRTTHPFFTLVYPDIQNEMIRTMIDMYKENGYLPKWELTGNETFMMVGDPAVPVIVDSYIKGIRDFDIETAFEAMLKTTQLNEGQKAAPVRAGYHQMLEYEYIPFEQDWSEDWWVWGPVSTTLEYCLADWNISVLAKSLGEEKYYNEYLQRSMYYKNLFDKETRFIRPKLKNGDWIEPFDSLTLEGSGDWQWSGGPGYVEGNAWHYTWFVPHDIPGLISLFKDEAEFVQRLKKCFGDGHFTVSNEPDFAYPYLFNYVEGQDSLTRYYVKDVLEKDFGLGPEGLPGNDDCGAMSAWYIFSSLGFYPDCPGSVNYQLGNTLFNKVEIKLDAKYYSGESLIIKSIVNTHDDFKVELNGKIITVNSINHEELTGGGELIFYSKENGN
ncbi:MAG: GH92 family glycosyl hydrolase [Melioribacteraceae bacterium]|nr:GH92 family glycosyl hydrolase [Melioribacteraceae bacterium]MCF8353542.1 GH92 family glycosyl hydrolase [Melioribacteraceae bacterium]MCF8392524.1 GH92 family glycosyl hydrolase [Melioribacteraceae bacterium]MCF8418461.1 GH92 family glycosyl hydrolase [Melioribacteraceae bacterium]